MNVIHRKARITYCIFAIKYVYVSKGKKHSREETICWNIEIPLFNWKLRFRDGTPTWGILSSIFRKLLLEYLYLVNQNIYNLSPLKIDSNKLNVVEKSLSDCQYICKTWWNVYFANLANNVLKSRIFIWFHENHWEIHSNALFYKIHFTT